MVTVSLVNSFLIFLRNNSQLLASIIKSSVFGLVLYFFLLIFNRRYSLNLRNISILLIIVCLCIAYMLPVIVEYSENSVTYIRTIFLWMLPILFYLLHSKDLNIKAYKLLLFLMVIYSVIDFSFINFTNISFFDSDRLRGNFYGLIRSEGVSQNPSISSALIVSVFLKLYLEDSLSFKLALTTLVGIFVLGSGTGLVLLAFSIFAFVLNKKVSLVILISFIFLYITKGDHIIEILNAIHPKISYEYITYLIDLKYERIVNLLDIDYKTIGFGVAATQNLIKTSGDFGYLVMLSAIGLPLMSLILLAVFFMFIEALNKGNGIPFIVLIVASAHYPIFIDPLAAYVLAQYAISRGNFEE